MFNQSSESGEYSFYPVSKVKINEYDISDFKLVTEDGWTTLQYKGKNF